MERSYNDHVICAFALSFFVGIVSIVVAYICHRLCFGILIDTDKMFEDTEIIGDTEAELEAEETEEAEEAEETEAEVEEEEETEEDEAEAEETEAEEVETKETDTEGTEEYFNVDDLEFLTQREMEIISEKSNKFFSHVIGHLLKIRLENEKKLI
jgi:hypothetical protein